ncbi:hypothetical protein WCP94_001644 [Bilophila wadsworthia]
MFRAFRSFGPFLIAPDGFCFKRCLTPHFALLFFAPDLLERQGMTAGKE